MPAGTLGMEQGCLIRPGDGKQAAFGQLPRRAAFFQGAQPALNHRVAAQAAELMAAWLSDAAAPAPEPRGSTGSPGWETCRLPGTSLASTPGRSSMILMPDNPSPLALAVVLGRMLT